MGVGICRGSKCDNGSSELAATSPANPNPRRFTILRSSIFYGWTVVEVLYPDATNYEGRKVMVYQAALETIKSQTSLDPHFCDDASHLSPFARFEPTSDGWDAAIDFIRLMVRGS